jgi:NAD(P)-dependent dehydrogenase (short-subunit alcohol dehydrogenase family)
MLTYSLAHGLADNEIRVNAIHPGSIETNIVGNQEISRKQVAALLGAIPLGRYGQPAGIGEAAVFLASELASCVTGESLVAGGGWTSWG